MTPRVVVAHEWLTTFAGSDQVARAIADLFPGVRVVTAIADPSVTSQFFRDIPVEVLWTNRLPGAHRRWEYFAPAMALAWARLRLDCDLLISSSHFASKAAGNRFDGPHACYCHTPSRIAWRPDLELSRLPRALHLPIRPLLALFRGWDRATARTVDRFFANSNAVATRISDAYQRDSDVIFPPVDVERFLTVERRPRNFLLAMGRLVPYKRFDLAIEAANILGADLVVAGGGPDAARLRSLAGPTVRFAGAVTNEEYRELLGTAKALLFPGEEDFGLVPVEAQAAGCPVIAYRAGGALDTVQEGRTGSFFDHASAASLVGAINRAEDTAFDESALRSWALNFSCERFSHQFYGAIGDLLQRQA